MRSTTGRYQLPNLLASDDDFERLQQRDLGRMDDRRLLAEDIRVKAAYAAALGTRIRISTPYPAGSMLASDWLLERMRTIADESQARLGRSRR